jgi:hypothetical protein
MIGIRSMKDSLQWSFHVLQSAYGIEFSYAGIFTLRLFKENSPRRFIRSFQSRGVPKNKRSILTEMSREQVTNLLLFYFPSDVLIILSHRFVVRDFIFQDDLLEKTNNELQAAEITEKELWVRRLSHSRASSSTWSSCHTYRANCSEWRE